MILLLSLLLSITAPINFSSPVNEIKRGEPVNGTLPTTINLNDSTEQEVRNYYSSLNNLSDSEKTNTNVLKNLKPILKDGQGQYSYDSGSDIWKIYEIADRDWTLSPASSVETGTYNAATNTITGYKYGQNNNNPYVHALYVNRDVENPMKAWGNHDQTYGGINREHIWPKSRGFDNEGGVGARGDLMHLWAADGYTNNLHRNFAYGYVDMTKSYTKAEDTISYAKGNYKGTSRTLGSGTVFEPQDSDKGDIARAVFYMVARYNNLAGDDNNISQDNPNLTLANTTDNSTQSSTATTAVSLGILDDLLEWHRQDPVDEYEIHRNNLLFNNYTHNRNPFIDFPEWVEIIWGTKKDTAFVNPLTDELNVGKTQPQGGGDTPSNPTDGEIIKGVPNMYLFIGAGVVVFIIVIIIIILAASGKLSKKDVRTIKKVTKSVTKGSSKKKSSSSKKKSSSSKKK